MLTVYPHAVSQIASKPANRCAPRDYCDIFLSTFLFVVAVYSTLIIVLLNSIHVAVYYFSRSLFFHFFVPPVAASISIIAAALTIDFLCIIVSFYAKHFNFAKLVFIPVLL